MRGSRCNIRQFQARNDDCEMALALNLTLQPSKRFSQILNLAAAQTGHVEVIPLRTPL